MKYPFPLLNEFKVKTIRSAVSNSFRSIYFSREVTPCLIRIWWLGVWITTRLFLNRAVVCARFLRSFSIFVGQNVLRSESLDLPFSLFPPMRAFCCASKPALVPCLCQPAQQTGHHRGEQAGWVTAAQVSLLLWKHTDPAPSQLKSYCIFHSREHGCNLAWRSWV